MNWARGGGGSGGMGTSLAGPRRRSATPAVVGASVGKECGGTPHWHAWVAEQPTGSRLGRPPTGIPTDRLRWGGGGGCPAEDGLHSLETYRWKVGSGGLALLALELRRRPRRRSCMVLGRSLPGTVAFSGWSCPAFSRSGAGAHKTTLGCGGWCSGLTLHSHRQAMLPPPLC